MRLTILAALLAVSSPAQTPADGARAAEQTLGRKMMADLEAATTRIGDATVEAYVARVVERVAPYCGPAVPVETRVIISRELNASAIPGGHVILNSGLLAAMESEAELAGVVAHLLAYLRDSGHARPRVVAGASVPLVFMGGWRGYDYGVSADSRAVPVAYLETIAADIVKADTAAVHCLVDAGYDPEPFRENLRKLAEAETHANFHTTTARYLTASDRAEKVGAQLRDVPVRPEYVLTRAGFSDVRARAERATAPIKREPPTLRRSRTSG